MNRKLQRAMLALSTTATVFTLLLLAASPLPMGSRSNAPIAMSTTPLSDAAESIADDLVARRHLRHSRALLALPYFSFAQGLRRNGS
jgi:hypothetical protein